MNLLNVHKKNIYTLYKNYFIVSELNAEKVPDQARIFETANRYHFIHTLALLGLPLSRKPSLVSLY